jgi:hypothetical protein
VFESPARPNHYLKIARALRYRPLAEANGKLVVISSADAVNKDVLCELSSVLPMQFRYDPATPVNLAPLVKHGFLELRFEVAPGDGELLTRLSRRELAKLGFLGQEVRMPGVKEEGDQGDDELAAEASDICVDLLLKEIAAERLFVMLFLEAISDRRSLHERELATLTDFQLPSDFFPATFQVRDACISNASSIWVQRHFYL